MEKIQEVEEEHTRSLRSVSTNINLSDTDLVNAEGCRTSSISSYLGDPGQEESEKRRLPCTYFDYIIGTSTGGLSKGS